MSLTHFGSCSFSLPVREIPKLRITWQQRPLQSTENCSPLTRLRLLLARSALFARRLVQSRSNYVAADALKRAAEHCVWHDQPTSANPIEEGETMCVRCLILAYLLISAAPCFASEVQFLSGKFEASERDVRVSGQLFRPEGPGPHAAVVILHTCGGLTQHVTHDWPQYLVGLGYVVLAVDTLGSRGYRRGCGPMRDRFAAQARDAYGALSYLASQPYVDPRRVAAVGFSLGAITINEVIMARPSRPAEGPEFRAFASFYGRCQKMDPAAMRDAPLLQIIPEKDNYASVCIERSKSIRMDAHVLPAVLHAFDQPQITHVRPDPFGNPMLYDPAATEKSRALLREFLEKHLK